MLIQNHLSMEDMEIIFNKMKKSIYIECKDNGHWTGFFCNIPWDKWNNLRILITNNHVLEETDIKIGKIIKISMENGKKI